MKKYVEVLSNGFSEKDYSFEELLSIDALKNSTIVRFQKESNSIEGEKDTWYNSSQHDSLLEICECEECDLLENIEKYANMFCGKFRFKIGLNITINGKYKIGGNMVKCELEKILKYPKEKYLRQHVDFEILHPFTNGNGRVGRALWLRNNFDRYTKSDKTFLELFYYDTIDYFETKE